ncbi:phosphoribosyltransferase-like protein, partial [Baffinella frigidus]
DEPLVIVCTLKGATPFFADLARVLDCDQQWEFMSFSSYGNSAKSSGAVQLMLDLKTDIAGRDLLVVEDILDTGNTLKYMLKQLGAREPKSVKTAVLLHKVRPPPWQLVATSGPY